MRVSEHKKYWVCFGSALRLELLFAKDHEILGEKKKRGFAPAAVDPENLGERRFDAQID